MGPLAGGHPWGLPWGTLVGMGWGLCWVLGLEAESSCSCIGAKERKGCVMAELLLAWSRGVRTQDWVLSQPPPGRARNQAAWKGMWRNCSLNPFLRRDYMGGWGPRGFFQAQLLFKSPAPVGGLARLRFDQWTTPKPAPPAVSCGGRPSAWSTLHPAPFPCLPSPPQHTGFVSIWHVNAFMCAYSFKTHSSH